MRQKTVFKTDEISHLWIHQTQSEGRNPQGNLYFRDSILFSYRDSYPIAKIEKNKRGEVAVLIQEDTYRNTTARHISDARQASSHLLQFTVPCVLLYENNREQNKRLHQSNLTYYTEQIAKYETKAIRARSNAQWTNERLQSLITEANTYSKFFGLRKTFVVSDPETIKTRVTSQKVKARKENEARARKMQEAADKWVKGAPGPFPHNCQFTYLRIEGEELVTSKGARIPLDHARKGFEFVQKVKESGTPYQRNGHTFHLGHYAIDKIDTEGNVTAGCHYVTFGEIERIGAQL